MCRFTLLVFILYISYTYSNAYTIKRDEGSKLKLNVGKPDRFPSMSNKKGKKVQSKGPTSDDMPSSEETIDHQPHAPSMVNDNNLETGMPPKYPLNSESAEMQAHDNEIGGCRDHPRASLVCQRCNNRCFPAEHESYTYAYCRKSCHHCDSSLSSFHTYWRLRAASEFEPTWMLKELEFYPNTEENMTLVDDPARAYSSSSYAGYNASYAFDKSFNTAWYPSGWGTHDNNDDWIAYEFAVAVRVHAIRMALDESHRTASPKKIFVESSDNKFGPFEKKWTIHNPDFLTDHIYNLLECPVLWRKFEVEDGAWCYRQIARFSTWEEAVSTCSDEGGSLTSIETKEEQRFITDEIQLCGETWIGLSHRDQAYYWNDGTNSTYRNWKQSVTYSDVQKENLNCIAMDMEGSWYNYHCTNKFYFVCKKKLVPKPGPRVDLVVNPWPYDPEIPPVIFLYPNITVPVINSKNLGPGLFPDENGKVEEEEEEDEKTQEDLFYEQTVEHLREKGLKPSDEIENDDEQENNDFTKELNKIAISTNLSSDYTNETASDLNYKPNSIGAHQEEKIMEKQEAMNEEYKIQTLNAPAPKPDEPGKPIKPPPSGTPIGETNAGSLPRIQNGKPVTDQNDQNSPSQPYGQNQPQSGENQQNGSPPHTSSESNQQQASNNNNQQQASNNNQQQANNNNQQQASNNNKQQPSNNNQQQASNNNQQQASNNNKQQASNNNKQQPSNNNQQPSNNNQQPRNNNQQQPSNNNQQEQSNNAQASNNNNSQEQLNSNSNQQQASNNNNQQSGDNSGSAPKPQPQPTQSQTSTQPTNNNQPSSNQGWGNNGGLPPVMGGTPPSKIPEPPATKEGDGDDDSKPSVGEQADETASPHKEKSDGSNDDDNDDDNDEDSDDDNKENNDNEKNVPEKPIQVKNPDLQDDDPKETDTTVGGENNKQRQNFRKGVHVKKQKVNNSNTKRKKTASRKTLQTTAEEGSGSGDEGDDEELDGVLESITNDLW